MLNDKSNMQLSYDNFKKFLLGKQSGTMALLTGRVRVLGNLSTAMRIETIYVDTILENHSKFILGIISVTRMLKGHPFLFGAF